MAFIDLDSEDPTGPSFYNINSAVGYGCPNMEEDVKVVQFFMQRFFTIPQFAERKPWGTMVADGKVGPLTRAWIIRTQMVSKQDGANVIIDGVVDKAQNAQDNSNRVSSISHTDYLIRMMNNALRKLDTQVYKTLTTNPVVPPDIRMIFLQINGEGPPMNFGNN
jgi:hypothetical protein